MSAASSNNAHVPLSASTPPSATVKESDSPSGEETRSNPPGAGSGYPDKVQKPHRPLNRVPRACNACRKQKMKCTDADNPPCKRCRNGGIECVFEKPIRDTVNNSEQGIRIKNLETQVNSIQSTLSELVTTLRAAVPQASLPSPSTHSSSSATQHGLAGNPTPPLHPQQPSPAGGAAPSPSSSGNSTSVLPSRLSGVQPDIPIHQGYSPSSQQYPNPQMSSASRQYRSASSSSGHTTGYYSSPASYLPHMSPQRGSSQQLDRVHRNADVMAHDTDPRADPGHPPDMHAGQYAYGTHQLQNHTVQHFHANIVSHQHPVMPPPTSLPPFSAIDVHHANHRPSPSSLHVQTSQRTLLGGAPSPRKSPIAPVSPVHGFSVPFPPPAPHHPHSSHKAVSSVGSHHNPTSHPASYRENPHFGDHAPKHCAGDPLSSSNVTPADSSDDDGGPSELPTHGMVAPFVAIRGLADVADRVAELNGGESYPPTRSGSPSPSGQYEVPPNVSTALPGVDSHVRPDMRISKRNSSKSGQSVGRPSKRRKKDRDDIDETLEGPARAVPDVVTKDLITEEEARELFQIFFTGCSMFLPVFDAAVDTFDALHQRSPFCVDAICMVAAKVRDGGGPPSATYKKCLKEVHELTCRTLFAPVMRQEVVQAMIMVAGWGAGPKDSGWLTLGHATRMALELGLHKAWPRLLKRMHAGKMSTSQDERELVISARTWFCLYLFEHQMSFGTGRPAILKEDDSVHECRLLLTHPLTISDDMRLVSMVELMIIRERTHNMINPYDSAPIDSNAFVVLRQSKDNFESWLKIWSTNFSKRYDAAAFHRQSLEAQVAFAELYHNATALRTIRGPEDVARIGEQQRELAVRSIAVARSALEVCLRSPSYREGLKYAVQYTHLSATFSASFLIRLARLFPDDCDLTAIMADVEDLTVILSEIPATRYARTLKLMLRSAKRRRVLPASRLPENSVTPTQMDSSRSNGTPKAMQFSHPEQAMMGPQPPNQMMMAQGDGVPTYEGLDQFVRDFELMPGQDVPVWLSESDLGDLALSQQGLEAFLIPPSLDERMAPEIW